MIGDSVNRVLSNQITRNHSIEKVAIEQSKIQIQNYFKKMKEGVGVILFKPRTKSRYLKEQKVLQDQRTLFWAGA